MSSAPNEDIQGHEMSPTQQQSATGVSVPPICSCCTSPCAEFGSAVVLGHIRVRYFRCARCGLVRTEEPTWLNEAYSSPIASMDVGLLGRCAYFARLTDAVVRALPGTDRYLDWAGGYGILTRLLRDRGLNFWHHDPFATNLFAEGWEGNPADRWDVITLYEVLEHLRDPYDALAPLASASPVLLFSTELLPRPAPMPGSWWYYALETGQHISFYTLPALSALARRLDMRLISNGRNFHALYRRGALSLTASIIIRWSNAARLLHPILRYVRPTPSLLEHDFQIARRLTTESQAGGAARSLSDRSRSAAQTNTFGRSDPTRAERNAVDESRLR